MVRRVFRASPPLLSRTMHASRKLSDEPLPEWRCNEQVIVT